MKASVPAPWLPVPGPVVPALLLPVHPDSVLRAPLPVASVLPDSVLLVPPLELLAQLPVVSVLRVPLLELPLAASVPVDSVLPVAWA